MNRVFELDGSIIVSGRVRVCQVAGESMTNTDNKEILEGFKRKELQLTEELEAIRKVVAGLEYLVSLAQSSTETIPFQFPVDAKPSWRQAVHDVLQESGGPLHVKEIYDRVLAKGATTTAKNPLGILDLSVNQWIVKGVAKKVGPRTYQWVKK